MDKVSDFVRRFNLDSLVVVGTCERASFAEVGRAAESAGMLRFAVQLAPLGSICIWRMA